MIWIGISNMYDHQIIHEFPHGDFASDAFQHIPRVDWIKEVGNYKITPLYESAGYTDVVGNYPPGLFYISAIFSLGAGIPSYDAISLITVLMLTFSCLLVYILIREFNKTVALLALPLMAFMFVLPFNGALMMGSRPFLMTNLFVAGFFWSLSKSSLKNSFILIGVFWAATIMSHGMEFFYVAAAFGIVLALKIVTRRLNLNMLKNYIISGVLTVILVFYFGVIFAASYLFVDTKGYFPKGFFVPVPLGSPEYSGVLYPNIFDTFPIFFVIIVIGVILGLFILLKYVINKKSTLHLALLYAFFGLTASSLNLVGSRKSFQSRFLLPVYTAVFFGIALYYVIDFIKRSSKIKLKREMIIGISFLMLLGITFAYYEKPTQLSSIDPYHWEAITWLREETEEDAVIYFFYGDLYQQDSILRNSHRFHFQVYPKEYAEAMQNKTVNRYYLSERPGEGTAKFPYRVSFFEFKTHGVYENDLGHPPKKSMQDICSFDYYIFDIIPKSSRNPALIQYNQFIRAVFLENGMKEVFNNQVISILRNDIKGQECNIIPEVEGEEEKEEIPKNESIA